MEHAKTFVNTINKFINWLEKAETQLTKLTHLVFVKAELQKQEKELQVQIFLKPFFLCHCCCSKMS